jgi:hypothetical protein
MSRTEYHQEYYWRNVDKRREQRASLKRRAKAKDTQALLQSWGRHGAAPQSS